MINLMRIDDQNTLPIQCGSRHELQVFGRNW